MKRLLKLTLTLLILNTFYLIPSNAQVGINNDNSEPDASAMLDVKSTDKGILIPRMTSSERQQILDPAVGLMVYDSTAQAFYYFNGMGWLELLSGTITDDQMLSFNTSNNTLSLEDGGSVDLSSIDSDDQTLSFNTTNNTLSIVDGNSVDISSINSVQSIIEDADGDTKIQVEESADEDVIRFDIENVEVGRFSKNANNNDAGLFIGNNNNTFLNVNPPNNTGDANTFIGSNAGASNVSGRRNTLVGRNAGTLLNDGTSNVFVGTIAGIDNSNGSNNVFIGDSAGSDNTDGSNNVAIGAGAGNNLISGSKNVFIGPFAGSNELGSNKLYIEPGSSSSPLIYGEFDNDLVRINGDLEVTGSFPDTDDQTLSFDDSNNTLSIADGNSVDLSSLRSSNPVGTIIMWIGDENETVPDGWLICDNRLYNTATYPDLFALLGSDRTPNFLGRFPVGAPRDGINGATSISVGGTGGEEDKTLSVANLPPHSHEIKFREGDESGSNNDYSDINAPNNEKNATGSTESTGDGQSFKIMPPFLGVQFLIKAE